MWAYFLILSAGLAATSGCGDAAESGRAYEDDAGRSGFDAQPIVYDGALIGEGDGAEARDAALSSDAGAAPDAEPRCSISECDPREDSCPGENCTLTENLTECVPRIDGFVGAICESSRECGQGLACFRLQGQGICERVCCGGDSTCAKDQTCTGPGILVDGTETSWNFCTGIRTCDVLTPHLACEPSEGCYIATPEGVTNCMPVGMASLGAACEAPNDCEPGLFCGGLIDRTCSRICSENEPCPASEGACVVYSYSPPGTGICTLE